MSGKNETGNKISKTLNQEKEKEALKNKTHYIRTTMNEIDILSYLSEGGIQSETNVRLMKRPGL